VTLERAVLEKNDRFAAENRKDLAARRVLALNVVGAPGAGKTALLERAIPRLAEVGVAVIEGDQETEHDAARIRAAGAFALQINTGTGCHLDAHAVGHAIRGLAPRPGSVLFVENVGNLVCPALFDLGEQAKVVVLSVTEGDDKPLKYPHMFRAARVMVLNKVDLLPYVTFDVARCIAAAKRVQPALEVIEASAARGTGVDAFVAWVRRTHRAFGNAASDPLHGRSGAPSSAGAP
jgi:hydrogenase nickel incorporation protein HypB